MLMNIQDIARDPKDTIYKYIKVHILSPPQIS